MTRSSLGPETVTRKPSASSQNAQEKQHFHSNDWQRTVYINTLDVGTTDFDLSHEKNKALVEQGIQGAETYFQWFEDQQESPVNCLEPNS